MTRKPLPLSQRIRPDCEAAPWVIEQVIQLENTISSLQHQLDISVAFHKVAIKERDFERSRVEILQTEVERLRGLLPPTAHAGVRNGPGEGSWSVYAGKLAEERDTALAEAERLRAELALLRKDWCDDDEAIKQQALRVLDAAKVDGDSWSVPRGSALAEMMADELVKVRAELAAAKAASVCPVELVALGDADWECSVGVKCKSSEDADTLYNWLRDRMKERGEG